MTDKATENRDGRSILPRDEGVQTIEEQREAPEWPKAERFYVEHLRLPAEIRDSPIPALQRALNEGARQSWKLVSVTREPTSRGGGYFLVWDTGGFISG